MRYFIGVDIGTKSAGVAMVDDTGVLVCHWQIDVRAHALIDAAWVIRASITRAIDRILDDDERQIEHHVEDPPYCKNVHTYQVLQRLFGAVFHDRRVHEWTPAQIKACFAGNGRASKEDVQFVAKMQFGIEVGPDEADAIAVAWTGYSAWKEKQVREALCSASSAAGE